MCRRWEPTRSFPLLTFSFFYATHHFYMGQISQAILMSLRVWHFHLPDITLKNIIFTINQKNFNNRKNFTLNYILRKTEGKWKGKMFWGFFFLCIMVLNWGRHPQSLENVIEQKSNPELVNQVLSHYHFRKKKYSFSLKWHVALTWSFQGCLNRVGQAVLLIN